MSPDEAHRLSLALESMRGTMETGFATVRGDINLLSRDAAPNASERIKHLEADVEELKERRVPILIAGPLLSLGALGISAYVAFAAR